MLYIDISRGVTFPLLLEAIACHNPDFLETVSQSIIKDTPVHHKYPGYFQNALKQKTIADFCKVLSETVSKNKAINISSLMENDPFLYSFTRNMQKAAPGFLLDPLEVCIYISLAAYMAAHSFEVRLFCPGVHINSSQYTLDILKGSSAVLKEHVPAVSFFCAKYLLSWGPFLTSIRMDAITEWQTVSDPLNPLLEARVFSQENADYEEVAVIETNIDDMTPEVISQVMTRLLEKGALDTWISPVTMKKSRQAFWLHIIVRPEEQKTFADFLLKETSTFGIRYSYKQRKILKRDIIEYKTPLGTVHVKRGFLNGKCIKAIPEFEDLSYISKTKNIPLSDVFLSVNAQINNDFGLRNEQEQL